MKALESDLLYIEVNPHGAELSGIYHKQQQAQYLWQADASVWGGRSPILFPIVGRIADDACRVENRVYPLYKHGFARKSEFEYEQRDPGCAVFTLRANEATRAQYPYEFALSVTYRITQSGLEVLHTVTNHGDGTMDFSIGGHPGFRCRPGDTLLFEQPETLSTQRIGADALLTGERVPVLQNSRELVLQPGIFDKDALVFENPVSQSITLHSSLVPDAVRMDFGRIPFLGLWAKPGAEYVCIEPWFGINGTQDDAGQLFSQKKGVLQLQPGQNFNFRYEITLIPRREIR